MADFIKPVDLPVSSPFGQRASGFHPGIDFSDGVPGHPIQATADGTVVFNAFESGLGNTVTLQHDGIKSGYGHMLELSTLPIGARVRQGDVVGFVGSTGDSDGPHLHFWMGQNPNTLAVDPAPLLGGVRAPAPPTDDLPDEATFKKWLRAVLDEGTGAGQTSWARTSADTLGTAQSLVNATNGLTARIDELTAAVARLRAH